MMRRLSICLCLIAIAGFVALPAFAAVQNVKVSGDIISSGVSRNNLDLNKLGADSGSKVQQADDKESDLLSIARVRVDADLTDNVATSIRLLNERNWNGESTTADQNNRNIGLNVNNATSAAAGNDEKEIAIDLAYVTLKEFLYSPLTLTIGRQELHFGSDWIVGDPDTNGVALNSALAEGDLSARKSFDAIRAKLDYNPLVLDLVYAKVAENNNNINDDTTLVGGNASYEAREETTLEAFAFSKIRGSNAAAVTNLDSSDTTSFATGANRVKNSVDVVNTVGARAVDKSVNNLTLDVQGAYQFGTYNPKLDPNARFLSTTNKAETGRRSAWGAEVVATYDLKDIGFVSKYEPSITGAYVYLSGQKRDSTGHTTYKGWDGMFENQTFGHLINAIMGFSNSQIVGLSLKAKPISGLTAQLDYVSLWFNKRFTNGILDILSGVATAQQFRMTDKRWAGQEIDLTLTYDYTEDVQFSLLGGLFFPSTAINGAGQSFSDPLGGSGLAFKKAAAAELVGSMKVTF